MVEERLKRPSEAGRGLLQMNIVEPDDDVTVGSFFPV